MVDIFDITNRISNLHLFVENENASDWNRPVDRTEDVQKKNYLLILLLLPIILLILGVLFVVCKGKTQFSTGVFLTERIINNIGKGYDDIFYLSNVFTIPIFQTVINFNFNFFSCMSKVISSFCK